MNPSEPEQRRALTVLNGLNDRLANICRNGRQVVAGFPELAQIS